MLVMYNVFLFSVYLNHKYLIIYFYVLISKYKYLERKEDLIGLDKTAKY